MAGSKKSINKFRNAHFSKEIKLPVQVHFIREINTTHAKNNLTKKSIMFRTSSYLTEPFYKPIHHCFDVMKIK